MAIKIGMKPPHPGGFIKRSVLPDDLSVTAAAEVLGVGRPALSNLLNEKASLSPEMALRVEKAFGIKMDTLLRMQARYDAYHMRAREKEIRVSRFIPA
jgi:addiction module HigA family antidote